MLRKVKAFTVLKLSTVFTIACNLLINYKEAAAENLLFQENISISKPCRYRCPKRDNKYQDDMRQGNKFFMENDIHRALSYYEREADLSQNNIDTLENVAECYSKLGYHYRALDAANYILTKEPLYCFEGVYYKAKALLGLQRYNEAINLVTTQMSLNEELKNSRDLINLLTKLQKFEYQQRTGNYDILKLWQNDLLNKDYADYTGPVQIKDIPGKDRGLIATADIRAGQLLIAHKAFAVVYQEDLEDFQWNGIQELSEAISAKLQFEPEHTESVYNSYAGPKMSYLADGIGNGSVDYRRIEGICNYTTLISSMHPMLYELGRLRRGFWILPGYINHNGFDANSFWEIYGDIMVVRAIKNISEGEEITTNYRDLVETFEKRNIAHKHFGFQCTCSLCQADKNDSAEISEKRNQILAQFNAKVTATMMESYIEELEKLRPNDPELNVYILSPLNFIGHYFYSKGQYDKAAEATIKAHRIAKRSPMVTRAVECSLEVVNCYIALGDYEKIFKWIDILKEDLIIAFGSVEIYKVFETFTDTVDSLAKMGIKF